MDLVGNDATAPNPAVIAQAEQWFTTAIANHQADMQAKPQSASCQARHAPAP